jgi:hypothetical protein
MSSPAGYNVHHHLHQTHRVVAVALPVSQHQP